MRPLSISRFIMSIGLPVAIFPATFWLQLQLGYEVSLFPLYMLPIAAFSWRFGSWGAVISVLLATALWYAGNHLTDYQYTYEWARYYNTAVRGILFAAVGVFIILFKRVIEQHRRRMEAMRALLNVCHGCGSIQGSDGSWIPFDQLTTGKTRPLCECPTCTRIAQGNGSRPPMTKNSGGNAEGGKSKAETTNGTPETERRRSEGRRAEDGALPTRPWQPGDPDRRHHVRRAEDR